MSYFYYRPKITKDEFQEKADYLLSAHPEYKPVIIPNLPHHAICSSWWGQSWCSNLERYAIWSGRLNLGRNYVRNGAVIDLQINGGDINARVLGHLNEPYDVQIKIAPIPLERQREIENLASGKIQNLEDITSGNFPEELKEIFFQKGILFPRPDEIDFKCTCKDWANMCRHTAAALYGIGVRLDSNPLYFFEMRGIDVKEFISNVVNGKIEKMLSNMDSDSPRILRNVDLLEVFGLDVPITLSLPDISPNPDEKEVTSPVNTVEIVEAEEEEKQNILQHSDEVETVLNEQEQSKQDKQEKQAEPQKVQINEDLYEELTRLKIENELLKEKFETLTARVNKVRTAITHLL